MTSPALPQSSHANNCSATATASLSTQGHLAANSATHVGRSSSSFNPPHTSLAFTLIELLVVIAIIAILAGLAFPAVQGAMGSAKKAQARNDVNQLASAVKAFQLEHGRLPGSGTEDGKAPDNLIAILTSSNSQNPRGIVFFEPKIAKGKKNGLSTDDGKYYDPWGKEYSVLLDYNYDNKIKNTNSNQTNFTTVIVTSTGGSTNTNSIISNVK